jgi:hypothetical protein
MRGKALARVTLKMYAATWIARIIVWMAAGGSVTDTMRMPGWLADGGSVLFGMCVVNALVIVVWNLAGSIRDAGGVQVITIEEELTSWDRRPGGVHIITTGPHLKYVVPRSGGPLSGIGILGPAVYFHDADQQVVSPGEWPTIYPRRDREGWHP